MNKQSTIENLALDLNGSDLDFFKKERQYGSELLDSIGLPSTKDEYWKYTRLNKVFKKEYNAHSEQGSPKSREAFSEQLIRIVDGKWQSDAIDTDSFKVLAFDKAVTHKAFKDNFSKVRNERAEFLDAINHKNFQYGFYIWVARGVDAGDIEIQEFFNTSNKHYPQRYLIHLEEGAKLNLIQRQEAKLSNQFVNSLAEVQVAKDAILKLSQVQEYGSDCNAVSTIYAEQGDKSIFDILTASLSGELIRNNLNIAVKGEFAETHLNGISVGRNEEHIDHHTIVDHLVPNCNSFENYKGIFYDKSKGVFNGKVFVRPDAQKTNAFQSNQNIVMSDDAKVYSKPELEIYADDVKCSHGSTTGQFDEEAVFYLQSRGIGIKKAKAMLVHAFLEEISSKVENENLRTYLEVFIDNKLADQ